MKKLFTSILFAFVFNVSLYAQEKTYFDQNWEKTTQDKMEFYRETESKGKLTFIRDFYKNGKLQMEGLASDATPNNELFEGKVTWYTPEGKISSVGTFSGGKQVGLALSYDAKGRILEDMVYSADGNMKGKSYDYKDIENESYYNSLTIYESSESHKTVIYDEDIKGIRYESIVSKNGDYETKYYGDKGKHIGTNSISSNNPNDVIRVEYYPNPMRVSKIQKFKSDGTIKESTLFGKNGKILQEEKRNKKDGYKVTYDESGKKIGNLTYQPDKEYEQLIPFEGEDYQYNDDFTIISTINIYKNGSAVLNKIFDENGTLSSEKILKEGILQEVKYYNKNGSLKSTLTYKEEIPYHGTLYEDNSEKQYKDGVLVYSKVFTDEAKLKSEKRLNTTKNTYESTIYNNSGAILHTYSQPVSEEDGFTAQIIQYANGKTINKASVKNDVLQSGKLRLKTDLITKELERSGKWILLKIYNAEGKLVQDSKVLVSTEQESFYGGIETNITESDLLDRNN